MFASRDYNALRNGITQQRMAWAYVGFLDETVDFEHACVVGVPHGSGQGLHFA